MGTEVTGQPVQEPAPSLEERMGALMGIPEDPIEGEEEAPVEDGQPQGDDSQAREPETFELELDGEKFVLPKKLEKGFLQEKDYSQKSMSLAEQRRALETHQESLRVLDAEQRFRTEIGPELGQLGMLDTLIQQASQLNWADMSTDELMRKRMELDGLKDQRSQLQQALQGKQAEWGRKQSTALTELRAKGLEAVKKAIPNWTDDTGKTLKEYGLSMGYTAQELDNIFDPRAVLALWKSQQYDTLKTRASAAVKGAKNIRTGSSNPMPQGVKSKLAFQKGLKATDPGSSERKALIEDRIASKFGG